MQANDQFNRVAEVYDDLMAIVPYQAWVDYAEGLWGIYGFRPQRILDLACGTGAVLEELHHRGYDVIGVDSSPGMLAAAARRVPPGVELLEQDMSALELPEHSLDACVCLFDSLNYLLTVEDVTGAFRGLARALRPGSPVLFDVNTILALEQGMFTQSGRGRNRDMTYDWQSAWEPHSRLCTVRMEFRLTRNGQQEVFFETHRQRGYHQWEIERALSDAGLELVGVFDAFTRRPPRVDSDRLHWLARTPVSRQSPGSSDL